METIIAVAHKRQFAFADTYISIKNCIFTKNMPLLIYYIFAIDIPFQGNVWPSGRSGGMIVVTSILSVLLAILLICLITALVFGR